MLSTDAFIQRLETEVACKTLYVKGGFGLRLDAKGKKRAIDSYAYNAKRADKINAMPNNSFGFDCIGTIKGAFWGFTGDTSKVYGGAIYKSNDVPDVNELGMFKLCYDVSTDFSNIQRGEYLYMKGHCGTYIGSGRVIESTPAGKDGVQITDISFQKWTHHAKIPFVKYEDNKNIVIAKPTLKRGSKGMQVYYLQQDLNALGASLETDGIFGALTDAEVRKFQRAYNLAVDGIYGPRSYAKMREVLA